MELLSRILPMLASACLAAVLGLSSAGFASAQDVNDDDVSEQPEVVVPHIAGCWQGNAFNDSQGNNNILLFFQQTKNKFSKKKSTVALQGGTAVFGHISGKIKPHQFFFHGKVATGCVIRGLAFFQEDGTLTGHYRYTGICFENQFTGGDFSKVTFLGPSCP